MILLRSRDSLPGGYGWISGLGECPESGGDKDGSDMTSRAVSGWGIADEMGFAVGRNGD